MTDMCFSDPGMTNSNMQVRNLCSTLQHTSFRAQEARLKCLVMLLCMQQERLPPAALYCCPFDYMLCLAQWATVEIDANAPENANVEPELEPGEFIDVFLVPLAGLHNTLAVSSTCVMHTSTLCAFTIFRSCCEVHSGRRRWRKPATNAAMHLKSHSDQHPVLLLAVLVLAVICIPKHLLSTRIWTFHSGVICCLGFEEAEGLGT